ncbi:MAG: hypothetical protein SFZ03_05020 [Candidatus Melainabacteria bacterium]|nr:hypothetical protein [Candidatus Melainabacteria bacterium]
MGLFDNIPNPFARSQPVQSFGATINQATHNLFVGTERARRANLTPAQRLEEDVRAYVRPGARGTVEREIYDRYQGEYAPAVGLELPPVADVYVPPNGQLRQQLRAQGIEISGDGTAQLFETGSSVTLNGQSLPVYSTSPGGSNGTQMIVTADGQVRTRQGNSGSFVVPLSEEARRTATQNGIQQAQVTRYVEGTVIGNQPGQHYYLNNGTQLIQNANGRYINMGSGWIHVEDALQQRGITVSPDMTFQPVTVNGQQLLQIQTANGNGYRISGQNGNYQVSAGQGGGRYVPLSPTAEQIQQAEQQGLNGLVPTGATMTINGQPARQFIMPSDPSNPNAPARQVLINQQGVYLYNPAANNNQGGYDAMPRLPEALEDRLGTVRSRGGIPVRYGASEYRGDAGTTVTLLRPNGQEETVFVPNDTSQQPITITLNQEQAQQIRQEVAQTQAAYEASQPQNLGESIVRNTVGTVQEAGSMINSGLTAVAESQVGQGIVSASDSLRNTYNTQMTWLGDTVLRTDAGNAFFNSAPVQWYANTVVDPFMAGAANREASPSVVVDESGNPINRAIATANNISGQFVGTTLGILPVVRQNLSNVDPGNTATPEQRDAAMTQAATLNVATGLIMPVTAIGTREGVAALTSRFPFLSTPVGQLTTSGSSSVTAPGIGRPVAPANPSNVQPLPSSQMTLAPSSGGSGTITSAGNTSTLTVLQGGSSASTPGSAVASANTASGQGTQLTVGSASTTYVTGTTPTVPAPVSTNNVVVGPWAGSGTTPTISAANVTPLQVPGAPLQVFNGGVGTTTLSAAQLPTVPLATATASSVFSPPTPLVLPSNPQPIVFPGEQRPNGTPVLPSSIPTDLPLIGEPATPTTAAPPFIPTLPSLPNPVQPTIQPNVNPSQPVETDTTDTPDGVPEFPDPDAAPEEMPTLPGSTTLEPFEPEDVEPIVEIDLSQPLDTGLGNVDLPEIPLAQPGSSITASANSPGGGDSDNAVPPADTAQPADINSAPIDDAVPSVSDQQVYRVEPGSVADAQISNAGVESPNVSLNTPFSVDGIQATFENQEPYTYGKPLEVFSAENFDIRRINNRSGRPATGVIEMDWIPTEGNQGVCDTLSLDAAQMLSEQYPNATVSLVQGSSPEFGNHYYVKVSEGGETFYVDPSVQENGLPRIIADENLASSGYRVSQETPLSQALERFSQQPDRVMMPRPGTQTPDMYLGSANYVLNSNGFSSAETVSVAFENTGNELSARIYLPGNAASVSLDQALEQYPDSPILNRLNDQVMPKLNQRYQEQFPEFSTPVEPNSSNVPPQTSTLSTEAPATPAPGLQSNTNLSAEQQLENNVVARMYQSPRLRENYLQSLPTVEQSSEAIQTAIQQGQVVNTVTLKNGVEANVYEYTEGASHTLVTQASNGGIAGSLTYTDAGDSITINSFNTAETPYLDHGVGAGSALMRQVTQEADSRGIPVGLVVMPNTARISQDDLINIYQHYGFNQIDTSSSTAASRQFNPVVMTRPPMGSTNTTAPTNTGNLATPAANASSNAPYADLNTRLPGETDAQFAERWMTQVTNSLESYNSQLRAIAEAGVAPTQAQVDQLFDTIEPLVFQNPETAAADFAAFSAGDLSAGQVFRVPSSASALDQVGLDHVTDPAIRAQIGDMGHKMLNVWKGLNMVLGPNRNDAASISPNLTRSLGRVATMYDNFATEFRGHLGSVQQAQQSSSAVATAQDPSQVLTDYMTQQASRTHYFTAMDQTGPLQITQPEQYYLPQGMNPSEFSDTVLSEWAVLNPTKYTQAPPGYEGEFQPEVRIVSTPDYMEIHTNGAGLYQRGEGEVGTSGGGIRSVNDLFRDRYNGGADLQEGSPLFQGSPEGPGTVFRVWWNEAGAPPVSSTSPVGNEAQPAPSVPSTVGSTGANSPILENTVDITQQSPEALQTLNQQLGQLSRNPNSSDPALQALQQQIQSNTYELNLTQADILQATPEQLQTLQLQMNVARNILANGGTVNVDTPFGNYTDAPRLIDNLPTQPVVEGYPANSLASLAYTNAQLIGPNVPPYIHDLNHSFYDTARGNNRTNEQLMEPIDGGSGAIPRALSETGEVSPDTLLNEAQRVLQNEARSNLVSATFGPQGQFGASAPALLSSEAGQNMLLQAFERLQHDRDTGILNPNNTTTPESRALVEGAIENFTSAVQSGDVNRFRSAVEQLSAIENVERLSSLPPNAQALANRYEENIQFVGQLRDAYNQQNGTNLTPAQFYAQWYGTPGYNPMPEDYLRLPIPGYPTQSTLPDASSLSLEPSTVSNLSSSQTVSQPSSTLSGNSVLNPVQGLPQNARYLEQPVGEVLDLARGETLRPGINNIMDLHELEHVVLDWGTDAQSEAYIAPLTERFGEVVRNQETVTSWRESVDVDAMIALGHEKNQRALSDAQGAVERAEERLQRRLSSTTFTPHQAELLTESFLSNSLSNLGVPLDAPGVREAIEQVESSMVSGNASDMSQAFSQLRESINQFFQPLPDSMVRERYNRALLILDQLMQDGGLGVDLFRMQNIPHLRTLPLVDPESIPLTSNIPNPSSAPADLGTQSALPQGSIFAAFVETDPPPPSLFALQSQAGSSPFAPPGIRNSFWL